MQATTKNTAVVG